MLVTRGLIRILKGNTEKSLENGQHRFEESTTEQCESMSDNDRPRKNYSDEVRKRRLHREAKKTIDHRIRIKLVESDGKTGFSDARSCTHCNSWSEQ